MKRICEYAGPRHDQSSKQRALYNKITGDTDLPDYSMGITKGGVGLLPSQQAFNQFHDIINL